MQAIHAQKSSPKEQDLESLYLSVRNYTEEICAPLEIEDYIPQPSVDVSPPKWNIAHTTWFFEEMILKQFAAGYQEFDPNFGFLFNSYYNSLGNRTARNNRGDLSRPTVKEVYQYRKYVDEKMCEFLRQNLSEEVRELIVLGLHHEQQHQELLITDLKFTLSCNPLFPVYKAENIICEKGETQTASKDKYISVKAGIYEIGFQGTGFHFDNELGRHKVYLHDFEISSQLITNAEFLEFIEDGGYENFRFWHAEGWDWVDQNEIKNPLHWHYKSGEWFHFTLGGLRKLNPETPVCHVSFYEAAAFAEWKGARLPTEFEWEAASDKFGWGLRWEWTASAYLPYPNFTKPAGAVGEYNGKFMVNQMVLRGASVATSPGHSRKTYRNFFHPPLRWQFTGIRLAK
jgi:ergothioneine biosynthesis protein EgtB